jgi:uncharacterized protein YsxB (DUF464 family)
MIDVSVTLSEEGVIENLMAEGHAGFALKGTDIVCAAFTILLRTFARAVEASPGVTWTARDDDPDRFRLAVTGVSSESAEKYRGWCEFLLRGLEDLKGDDPSRVRIEYGIHSGRLFHGS